MDEDIKLLSYQGCEGILFALWPRGVFWRRKVISLFLSIFLSLRLQSQGVRILLAGRAGEGQFFTVKELGTAHGIRKVDSTSFKTHRVSEEPGGSGASRCGGPVTGFPPPQPPYRPVRSSWGKRSNTQTRNKAGSQP